MEDIRMTARRRASAALAADHGTPERMRHGDLTAVPIYNHAGSAVGEGRRVMSPIERLAKQISGPMLVAADRLRRDYECAVWRVHDRDRPVEPIVQRTRRTSEPTDLMIDAGRRIAAARAAMGEYAAEVVIAVVCDEINPTRLAQTRRQNRQEVVGVLKAGLDIVARCYGIRSEA
jgi:hypothetical protein